ncbi:hypothetical protein [Pedobacter frigoris]|uniref:Uncharacterized protein n=1 Tax=Pedobacter frigoris TaxID=2571272 RepID=A0A4U1CN40_9SPHI|nr:hypothetical protein [Pedobacter frigoris]TKC08853.1 hypothetical protein FA047_01790 [Pedobacter frigoris]
MTDLEYIAQYFDGELSEDAKKAFEERCAKDEVLAEQVAQYIMIKDALKLELAQHKKARFAQLYEDVLAAEKPQEKQNYPLIRKLSLYAAAACLALVAAWLIFFRSPDSKVMARDYIAANFNNLGVTMGASDQLQQGIAAFNKKDYPTAISIFETLTNDNTFRAEAVKNLGITYLITGEYDKAIAAFDELSKMDLYTNPGLFYKSIALLNKGDKESHEQAKINLEQVVSKDLAGSKEAKAWLDKL